MKKRPIDIHPEDLNLSAAAAIFDVPLNEVTPEMRTRARTINFASHYAGDPVNHFPIAGTLTGRVPNDLKPHNMPLPGKQKMVTASGTFLEVDFGDIERRVLGLFRRETNWPYCPKCQQSATSMHGGRHTCTRCGWPTTRRDTLLGK